MSNKRKSQRLNVNSGKSVTKLSVPAAKGSRITTKTAHIKNSLGGVRVQHRELYASISGNGIPTGFQPLEREVNPGLDTTFAWLSKIASNYEKYEFHRLRFIFESEVGSETTGRITQCLDPDASDSAPDSLQQMMSYLNASTSNVWASDTMEVPKSAIRGVRFVRQGKPPNFSDIKMYDVGVFFVNDSSAPSQNYTGQLYVEYDVEFLSPQYNQSEDIFADSLCILNSPTGGLAVNILDNPTVDGGLNVNVVDSTTIEFCELGEYKIDFGVEPFNTIPSGLIDIVDGANSSVEYEVLTLQSQDDLFSTYSVAVRVTNLFQLLKFNFTGQGFTGITEAVVTIAEYAWELLAPFVLALDSPLRIAKERALEGVVRKNAVHLHYEHQARLNKKRKDKKSTSRTSRIGSKSQELLKNSSNDTIRLGLAAREREFVEANSPAAIYNFNHRDCDHKRDLCVYKGGPQDQ